MNAVAPGVGSGSDINLIPPHTFSVPSGFASVHHVSSHRCRAIAYLRCRLTPAVHRYANGWDGVVVACTSADCPSAFRSPDDTRVVTVCQVDNVSYSVLVLRETLCADGFPLRLQVDLVITFCG